MSSLKRSRKKSQRCCQLTVLVITLMLIGCSKSSDPAVAFRDGDFDHALSIFSQRAESGDVAAINFLGIHYYLGAGVERDFERAASYFEQAALENNADAQRNLAILYMRGLGVEQDNHRAYAWFFQSYSGGNPNARAYMRVLSDNITPNAGGQARAWVAKQVREHAKNKAQTQ